MAEIDIRNEQGSEEITKIVFSDTDYIEKCFSFDTITIKDKLNGKHVAVYKEDIPNLIKALQKAMELWN